MMLFDGPVSQRGYKINKFAKSLTTQSGRAAFAADPRGAMQSFGLDAWQMGLIEARDWQALLQEGAAVYLLAKLAIAQGESLMDIGAQMRGQTTPEFLQSLDAQRWPGRL
jgi:protocatechuate 4,5-dioxygenase alpha subunit